MHSVFVVLQNIKPYGQLLMKKNFNFSIDKLKNNQQNLLILLSLAIGILTSLVAFALKSAVHYTHEFVSQYSSGHGNFLFIIFPVIGIILTVLFVKYIVKDDISHGISKILYSISKKQGRFKKHNNWSSVIASILTIGFGGSVGAEAPIVLTGASIGSRLGRAFKLNHKTLIMLAGCGSAGAIAGIFKAPIAGIVFTLEVLMIDLTMASLVPLLVASVTSTSLAYLLQGDASFFNFMQSTPFDVGTTPFFIVVGIFTGILSVYFSRQLSFTESKLSLITSPVKRIAVGGIILSLLIFLFPALYGEGYGTISILLSDDVLNITHNTLMENVSSEWLIFLYVLAMLLLKVFATALTTGIGGVGGVFAPTLFMGGISGFLVAFVFNQLGFELSYSNFVLVGMAGMMAGVMHAPLTGIFLIAELSGGYGLILPLMMASVIAFITIKYYEPHSIYHKRLAQRGELLTHHKDKTVLTLMKLNSVIERDLDPIGPDATLGELVKVISKSKRNIFPVIDDKNELHGIVLLDDIRNLMFRPEKYDKFTVTQLMSRPPAIVETNDAMETVMSKFEQSGAWNLPVVENGKYVGFISKSRIFNAYRKVLVHYSDE